MKIRNFIKLPIEINDIEGGRHFLRELRLKLRQNTEKWEIGKRKRNHY